MFARSPSRLRAQARPNSLAPSPPSLLNSPSLSKAREVHAQLLDILKQQKVAHVSCGGGWDVVRKAICSAYFYNSARLKGVGEYMNMLTSIPCNLHPSSALFGLGYTPDYVCYHELVMTQKEYMRSVTAVDGEWLAELGPVLFSVKESYKDRLLKRKREQDSKDAMGWEMEQEERRKLKEREAAELEERRAREAARTPRLGGSVVATPGFSGAGGAGGAHRTPRRVGL